MPRRRRPAGPFPYPSTPAWQDDAAEALSNVDGANAPGFALAQFAAIAHEPKKLIHRHNGRVQIRPEYVERRTTAEGDVVSVLLPHHPCGVGIYLLNDRLLHSWAAPGAGGLALPVPSAATDAAGTHASALVFAADSIASIRELYRHADQALGAADRLRDYDLAEDLRRNGQEQPGRLVGVAWEYPDPYDETIARRLVGAEAPMGNNRTRHRLGVFGWEADWPIVGVPLAEVSAEAERDGDTTIETNVALALELFSARLNNALADPANEPNPTIRDVANAAMNLAVVESYVVVGCSDPSRLRQAVSALNVRDHIKPPLEFDALAVNQAKARALAAAHRRHGRIDDQTEAVLVGDLPATALPGLPACTTRVEAEDAARRQWQRMLMPTDPVDRDIVREVLQERARTSIDRETAMTRAGILTAASARVRGANINSRLGERYVVTQVRNGIDPADEPIADVVNKAKAGDVDALAEIARDRLPELAYLAKLIAPDFGSAGAARRGLSNVVRALEARPAATAGLMTELVDARNENRQPRKVDEAGIPVEATVATREWFDGQFPKMANGRRRPTPNQPLPGETAVPTPERQYAIVARQLGEVIASIDSYVDAVPEAMVDVKRAAAAAEIEAALDAETATGLARSITEIRARLLPLAQQLVALSLPLEPDDPDLEDDDSDEDDDAGPDADVE